MKAAQINEYGDASVVTVREVEKPFASEGKVLIEVHASSINPYDITVRSGRAGSLALPITLGGDVAGVVSEVGEGVTGIAVGDKVYGQAAVVAGNSGAFAEYAATAAGQVAKAPANLDFKEAASLPLVGVSALQAITGHIKLATGQKILITGGAGGIGSIAVQIAKHIGAHVVTTATGEGLELAKKLGADEVNDYKTSDVSGLPHDFDAVFDTVGGENFDNTLHVLKKGGIAVSMIGTPNETLAKELEVTAMMQMTRVTTEALSTLRELVESGVVTPQVGAVFALEDIVKAFEAKEKGDTAGKIVIEIQ